MASLDNDADYQDGVTKAEVVRRLAKTAGQIFLRFKQYTMYPGRLSLLSFTYNSETAMQEAVHFAHASRVELDESISLPLQREVWKNATNELAVLILEGSFSKNHTCFATLWLSKVRAI